MKRISFDTDGSHLTEHERNHLRDCLRIVEVLRARGYFATRQEVYDAWSEYSETWAAGWWPLPEDDDELFSTALRYLKVTE
jgi:hypothetical protein